MSIKVSSHVWEHSAHKGSALLLLIAIADHAHDDGGGAYPSVEALAAKIRMTERNTQLLLRKLETSGELVIDRNAGPNGCNVYRIMMGAMFSGVKTFQGEATITRGVKAASPKPSVNRQDGRREGAPARDTQHPEPDTSLPDDRHVGDSASAAALAVLDTWAACRGTDPTDGETIGLQRLADAYGHAAVQAVIEAAARSYPDGTPRAFRTTPTPINLLRSMLQRAQQEGRAPGSDTRQYQQQQQQTGATPSVPSAPLDAEHPLVQTLADVCGVDLSVTPSRAFVEIADWLQRTNATPEQVRRAATHYRQSWRGKDGSLPTPRQIQAVWQEALGTRSSGTVQERARLMGELTLAQRAGDYVRVREIQIQMSAGGAA